jgi:hypothetical protein
MRMVPILMPRLLLLLALFGPWAHAHCLLACACCDTAASAAPAVTACCDVGREATQDAPSGALRRGMDAPMRFCACGQESGQRVTALTAETAPRPAPVSDALALAVLPLPQAPATPLCALQPPGGPPASMQALYGVFRC